MTTSIDEFASERFGEPLEALETTRHQALPSSRFNLPKGSMHELCEIRSRGLVSGTRRNSPEGVALREAGLTGRFGALTPDGIQLATGIRSARYKLVAERSTRAGTHSWRLWVQPGVGSVTVSEEGDREKVDVLSFASAIARLTAWLPLNPFWPIVDGEETEDHVISDEVIDARVRGEHVDIPDWAPSGLAHRWPGEWTSFVVGDPKTEEGVPIVVIDGATHLCRRFDEGCRLQLVPSDWVLTAIWDLIARGRARS
ncbi:hypothetical protein [Clavibacter michiganensis]|nr:hypothetical protein [Clavibacter michiganensis]